MPIKLLLFDVDGVLTEGEARKLDLDLFKMLARLNERSRQDSSFPAATLCTGRPAPYVEVLLQAIDGYLPAIFENGAGLYVPETYSFLPHPNLDGNDPAADGPIVPVRRRLADTLVRRGVAYFQPGKEHTLSLFATDPGQTKRLHEESDAALGELRQTVDYLYSPSCLNILPRGMHKGKGVEFLADYSGYALDDMLGVGDSDVDIPFLRAIGYSAAPSNANERVKEVAQYVSPYPAANGVRDILTHFGISG